MQKKHPNSSNQIRPLSIVPPMKMRGARVQQAVHKKDEHARSVS